MYFEMTLLKSYNALECIVDELNTTMMSYALSSFSNYDSCESQVKKIIGLIDCKRELINLKVELDKVLDTLEKEDRLLIGYKYFNEPIEEDFDHTSRKYFRKQQRALLKFRKALEKENVTEEWFLEKFGQIAFLRNTYNRMKNQMQNRNGKNNQLIVA